MEPLIQLTREPLDRDALIAAVSHASVGGIVVFEGSDAIGSGEGPLSRLLLFHDEVLWS